MPTLEVKLLNTASAWTWFAPVLTTLGTLLIAGVTIFVMRNNLGQAARHHAESLRESWETNHLSWYRDQLMTEIATVIKHAQQSLDTIWDLASLPANRSDKVNDNARNEISALRRHSTVFRVLNQERLSEACEQWAFRLYDELAIAIYQQSAIETAQFEAAVKRLGNAANPTASGLAIDAIASLSQEEVARAETNFVKTAQRAITPIAARS